MDNSTTAILIVDHGSRRRESNDMLLEVARRFAATGGYAIVEPAHMELADPTIAQAFAACVRRGARQIVVFPYFLSPGRHWTEDIPSLVRDAASAFPDVRWMVTAPFALHPGMLTIIRDRIETCLRSASPESAQAACDVCGDERRCRFRDGSGSGHDER